MEQRIDMLEREVVAIKSELAIIKTTYWMREDGRILDSRLSRLELDVAQLKTDVAQLKSDVSVIQLSLAKAEADIAKMKSDISRCFDEIQKINERLAKMEVRLTGMDERQDARDRRHTEIFESIEARLTAFASKDDALQADVYRLKTWVVTTAIAIVTANAAMLMLVV